MQTCPALRNAAQAPPLAATRDLLGDVGADDERVLAAHLEVDSRHPLGARAGDLLAGLDRAGEGEAGDPLVLADPGADVAGSGDDVDDAGRQVVEASARARVESGVSSEGLQTVALPAASAGASFHASSSSG